MSKKFNFLFDLFFVFFSEFFYSFKNRGLKNQEADKLFELSHQNSNKNILIVSLASSNFVINAEALFAKFFNLKGYNIYFLTNFRNRNAVKTFKKIKGKNIFHNFVFFKNGLKFLSKELPEINNSNVLKDFFYEGVNLGIGVYGTVSRKLKVGLLDFSDKRTRSLANKYLWRSIIYFETAKDIFKKINPQIILSLEKGYIGHSEIFALAKEKEINYIQWVACHEPNALIFKRYSKNNLKDPPISVANETWQEFSQKPWDEKYKEEVMRIFEDGYSKGVWFKYNNLMERTGLIGKEGFIAKYGLDKNKKIVVLFSHVMWDANLFYGKDLFGQGFGQWLIESVMAMKKNPNVNWLIKIHPANRFKHRLEGIEGEYRELVTLKKIFNEIPKEVKIIYPEDEINPYSLFNIIDCAITVRGTIGLEFPCFGVPVLTAGSGCYSNRGFTRDFSAKDDYIKELLDLNGIIGLGEQQKQLALKHAYIIFKLRPLKFESYQEKYEKGVLSDMEIKITQPEQGKDFMKFVDWAINSHAEDFLNNY